MPAVVTPIASFPTSTGNGTDPDGQLFMDSNGGGWTSSIPENNIGTTYEIAKSAFGTATPAYLTDIPTGLNTLEGVPNLSVETRIGVAGVVRISAADRLREAAYFPPEFAKVPV